MRLFVRSAPGSNELAKRPNSILSHGSADELAFTRLAEGQEHQDKNIADTPMLILGLDISKANFDAALLDGTSSKDQSKPRHKAFPNTPAGFERLASTRWLREAGFDPLASRGWLRPAGFERLREWLGEAPIHACLEATGTYGDALARFLHDHGHTVSVVNPARIKAFAQTRMARAKTDKVDALLIAQFCQMHRSQHRSVLPDASPSTLEPTRPRSQRTASLGAANCQPGCSQLPAWVRRLETLQQMRQMENNRLLAGVAASVAVSLQEHLDFRDAEIEKTKQRIQDHIHQNPRLQEQRDLLVCIPGIADTTAAALLAELLAELLDVRQFAGARQVSAFAGLVPRIRQSGSSVRGRACLSKVGSWTGVSVQSRFVASSEGTVLSGDGGVALQSCSDGFAHAADGCGQEQETDCGRGNA